MPKFVKPSATTTPGIVRGTRSGRAAGLARGATRAAVEMTLLEPRRLLAATIHDVLAIRVDNAIKVRDYADIWQPLNRLTRPSAKAKSHLKIDAFKPFALDATDLRAALTRAPMEFTAAAAKPVEVAIPTPDGKAARFAVVETRVMDPKLAAKYSSIRTYRGRGIDDPTATVRLDYTPQGFHAQVIAPGKTFYVDPYWHGSTSAYASYWYADMKVSPELIKLRANPHQHDHGGKDEDHADDEPSASATVDTSSATASRTSGTQLRTYRTAVAATGEYTAFHGGSVTLGQAAIVTAINRVTGIYESELTIRLQLIANNDTLVFTNVNSDPYTNSNGGAMLSQNQSTIDSRIGSGNYDLGHVFSTGGGGIAYLGVVGINGYKAGGVTGLPSPTGDAFYVDYVAHEMGHQFGANHTFNTSTDGNRNASTAYEPGGGSTIMGYAGITGDNLQNNSDPYFSFISFDEIIRHVDVTVPGVGTRTSTGNSVPTVNAGADFTIPASTPFALTASGSDADGDTLSYSWEQMDLGPARQLEDADNGSSPLFRVYNPTTSPTRVFPRLESILNGTNATPAPSGGLAERLPTLARAMDFRVTVRDNRSGGGGVNIDDMIVNVVNTGAAFAVTSFNSSTSLAAGSNQTISWNVAGTTGSGINAANVNILLSTDGGLTFPTLLASNTPNDGSQTITLLVLGTTQARIKVQPTNNIFFDINNANFTITSSSPQAPTIGSLTGSPDPVDTNAALTLTANTVADANGDPLTVSFYRETNGVAGLQTAGGTPDALVGSDTTSPYAITVTSPAANGSYTWYARATDPGSLASNVVSTTLLVGDPDDQIAEAIPFTFGNTVNGSIDPAGDVDMYAITVAAGQAVKIDIDLPGGSPLDALLRLFNGSGTQLALADDSPPAGPDPEYSTLEPYIAYTFATAGTYYVGVSSYQNSTYNPTTGAGDNAASTGPYTLTITTLTVDITDVTPDPRSDAVNEIAILFSEPVTGLDLSDLSLTRDGGPNLLTGAQTLITTSGSSYHLTGLSNLTALRGSYVLTLTADGSGIADATGNALTSGATDAWINNNALPVITDVFVGGTAWTSSFRNFLQSSGQGDAAYGYRLTDAQHADELPWINLNQVSVRFSEDVNLAAGAFRLFGVKTPQYAGNVTYDPATFTATFTLTAAPAFVNEKLLVHLLAAGVTDANGNALDGEWTNPTETNPVTAGGADSYPSGNGTAGGDFAMRINVLPGDVTRDGEVIGNDVINVRFNQGFMPGQSGYSIFRDVTGDGEIIGNDVIGVRFRQGMVLPVGTPIVPIAAPRTAARSALFASAASISLDEPKLISAYDLLDDEQERLLVG